MISDRRLVAVLHVVVQRREREPDRIGDGLHGDPVAAVTRDELGALLGDLATAVLDGHASARVDGTGARGDR